MIISDMYPTAITFTSGIKATDYIQNLPYTDDPAKAYYMGYIPYEDFPESVLGLSYFSFSDNLTTANFNHIAANHPWGYCRQDDQGTDTRFRTQFFAYYNGSTYRYNSNANAQTRLFNSLKVACINQCDNIKFQISAGAELTENITNGTFFINNTNSFTTISANKSLQEMIDFIYNDAAFTCSATYNGSTHTVSFKYSDFREDGYTAVVIDGTYTIFIQFRADDTIFTKPAKITYDSGGGVYVDGGSSLIPFIGTPLNADMGFDDQTGMLCMSGGAYDIRLNLGLGRTVFSGYSANVRFRNAIFAHMPLDSLKISDLPNSGGIPLGSHYYGVVNYNLFIKTASSDGTSIYIHPAKKPLDLLKCLQLVNRVQSGTTTQSSLTIRYGLTNSYLASDQVSLFDDENLPLWESMQGDTALAQDKLQPWQMPETDIVANEFDVNDMPPYNPPEPGEEGENIGDSIHRPASLSIGGTRGFITQYALNASQVGELGALLWTSVFDTDYWQNFLFSLALDTGSFSLSALLNFFLSLKVYPFSMVNVQSYSSWGQDMYFGTGIKELHFTTNLHTINNYADYVKGGWARVWSNNFFGDYRDYVNTEITLYIPYCGSVHLNPGDVVGNKISVEYAIDFATGGCIAYVDLDTGDGAGYPIAAIHGQIGADVPLTATAAGEVAARFIGDAAHAAGLIGGQAGKEISAVTGALSGHINPTPGSIGYALGGPVGSAAGFAAGLAPSLGAQALGMLTRGAVSAPMLSGGRGFASFGAPQVPYVQIRRGIYPTDTNLSNVAGQPAAAAVTIGTLSGFVQGTVKSAGMQGVTQEEQAAIIAAISAGIFV